MELWRFSSSAWLRKWIRVKGKIDGAKSKAILEENLWQSASDFRQEWRFTFLLDTNPECTATATLVWQDLRVAAHLTSPSDVTKASDILLNRMEDVLRNQMDCDIILAAVSPAKGDCPKCCLIGVNTKWVCLGTTSSYLDS